MGPFFTRKQSKGREKRQRRVENDTSLTSPSVPTGLAVVLLQSTPSGILNGFCECVKMLELALTHGFDNNASRADNQLSFLEPWSCPFGVLQTR